MVVRRGGQRIQPRIEITVAFVGLSLDSGEALVDSEAGATDHPTCPDLGGRCGCGPQPVGARNSGQPTSE